MPSVIAMISSIAGVLGLEDRVGGEARRDEDHRRVRAGLGDRLVERVEHRRALDVLAALAGRHARDEVRPVALVVHRVEGALAAGDARDAELACPCRPGSPSRLARPRAASSTTRSAALEHRGLRVHVGQVRLGQQLAALLVVGAVEAHDERHGRLDLLERLDQALGDLVAARDAAEDVEQHGGDVRVGEDHLDGGGDRLGLRAAAGVEEVRRRAARLGDDVQRGHHEAGAVAEDADVAVELDVGQAALAGHLLLRVLALGRMRSAALSGWRNSEESSSVTFASSAVTWRSPRDDQRVDLDEHRLLGDERVVELGQQRADRAHDVAVDAGLEGEPAARGSPGSPAAGRRAGARSRRGRSSATSSMSMPPCVESMTSGRLARAVEDDRRVVLGGDVRGGLDPDLVHGEAADVHAEDRLGVGLGLGAVLGDLDAAGLAAASDLHLRLDDAGIADLVGGGDGLLHGRRRGRRRARARRAGRRAACPGIRVGP